MAAETGAFPGPPAPLSPCKPIPVTPNLSLLSGPACKAFQHSCANIAHGSISVESLATSKTNTPGADETLSVPHQALTAPSFSGCWKLWVGRWFRSCRMEMRCFGSSVPGVMRLNKAAILFLYQSWFISVSMGTHDRCGCCVSILPPVLWAVWMPCQS